MMFRMVIMTQMVTPVLAQETYPNKPIRMIIAFAAGGPTDIPARLFADELSKILPQRVIVENRTGAVNLVADVLK